MMLNPSKCTFAVRAGEFLGFTSVNEEKIQAILDMGPTRRGKEVQKLTGCIAALNRFVSRSSNKYLPFFNVLLGIKVFVWIEECERAFQELKVYLRHAPILAKLLSREKLFTYLMVLEHAVNSVLVKEVTGVQALVYFVSKHLLDAELGYPELE